MHYDSFHRHWRLYARHCVRHPLTRLVEKDPLLSLLTPNPLITETCVSVNLWDCITYN